MGNLATDAYRLAVGADVAFHQVSMISNSLQPGELRSVDVFNAMPQVWNPQSRRAWTLKTFHMRGTALERLLNLVYGTTLLRAAKGPLDRGFLSVSGLSFRLQQKPVPRLIDVRIGGRPLNPARDYKVAASQGVLFIIDFIQRLAPGVIQVGGLQDTGLEEWKIVRDYLARLSPLTAADIPVGNRARSQAPDLGLLDADVVVQPDAILATIHNFGATPSAAGARVRLSYDRRGADSTRERVWVDFAPPLGLTPIAPGGARVVRWSGAKVPAGLPLRVRIENSAGESVTANDALVYWPR
jgi:hypothetical protein